VVKGEVCKTSMQRFESARRLQFYFEVMINPAMISTISFSATSRICIASRFAADISRCPSSVTMNGFVDGGLGAK
jgi:hypothetical protein